MFNEYVWNLYLESGGKDIVSQFENNLTGEHTEEYANFICKLHKEYCPSKNVNDELSNYLKQLFEDINSDEGLFYPCYTITDVKMSEDSFDDINKILNALFDGIKGEELEDHQCFEEFSCGIAYYTTFLNGVFPELFVPYYFKIAP